MDALKLLCLKLFLLFITIVDVISAARNLHIHKSSLSSSRVLFPKQLEGSCKGNKIEGIHGVRTYLQRYGYLSNRNNNVTTDALLFDDGLESAVKLYQKFFKLNVSGILDGETLGQMSKHRCGVPDYFFTENNNNNNSNGSVMHMGDSHYAFFSRRQRWPYETMHLFYGFINNFPTEYMGAVIRAFATWEANGRFSFSPAARIGSAHIKISFERGDHGDGQIFDGPDGEILAHASAPTDGRLHFNIDQLWADGPIYGSDHYDVESVALHELGHILGLGHTSVQNAVMWPTLESGVTKKTLSYDDISGLRALYS